MAAGRAKFKGEVFKVENIIDIIKEQVLHERLDDIATFAEESEGWEAVQREIEKAYNKLEDKDCAEEARELSDAFTGEEVRLQEAAYLIGMADGMALAEFKNERGKRS